MGNIKTYNNILTVLEDVATRHYQVHSFGIGDNWEVGASEVDTTPTLWVNPVNAFMKKGEYGYAAFEVAMNLKVFDLVDKGEDNEADVHSDTLQILQDVITEFTKHPYYTRSKFDMVGDLTFTPFTEKFDEEVTGWEVDVLMRTPNQRTFCGIPVDEIPNYSFPSITCTGGTIFTTVVTDIQVTSPLTVSHTGSVYTIGFSGDVIDNFTTASTLDSSTGIASFATVEGGVSAYTLDLTSLVTTGTTGDTRLIPLIYPANNANSIIPALGTNGLNAASDYSSILGGKYNTMSGPSSYSTIFGGKYNNLTTSDYSTMGGKNNILSVSNYSTTFGGESNTISNYSTHSVIGAGKDNGITKSKYSFIGAGNGNSITSTATNFQKNIIGGGYNNTISDGVYSSIVNGYANTISNVCNNSVINNGGKNVITSSNYSGILNGYENIITDGEYSGILLGKGNTLTQSDKSSIIGGNSNSITSSSTALTNKSDWSIVGGGYGNSITNTQQSSILGGTYNSIEPGGGIAKATRWSTIGGGFTNKVADEGNTIGGGYKNTISIGAFFANEGKYSFIGGGYINDIMNGNNNVIVGGQNNMLSGDDSFIGGGSGNYCWDDNSSVVGGLSNGVYSGTFTFIGGGIGNVTNNSQMSSIVGGQSNNLTNSRRSFIGGGYNNNITNVSSVNDQYCFIGAGNRNNITDSQSSNIIGGRDNTLSSDSHYSTINGGKDNTITTSEYSSILGGELGVITNSNKSIILSAPNHASWGHITNSSYSMTHNWCNSIGGGGNVLMGGWYNTATDSEYCNNIGGTYNTLTNSKYSTVIGGDFNGAGGNTLINVSGCTIIGSGNLINSLSDTHIIGSSITGTTSNTTYVNNFNINDTPNSAITDNVLVRESDGEITVKDTSPRYFKIYCDNSFDYNWNDTSAGSVNFTKIAWSGESINSGHFTHSTGGTGNTIVTITEDGIYDITSMVSMSGQASGSGSRVTSIVSVFINNVEQNEKARAYNRDLTNDIDTSTTTFNSIFDLSNGDEIKINHLILGNYGTENMTNIPNETILVIKKL